MYHITGLHGSWTFTRQDVMLLSLVVIWELVWKGIALWKAGRHKQLSWFVVMLVVNTLGILEIIYIVFFQAKDETKSS